MIFIINKNYFIIKKKNGCQSDRYRHNRCNSKYHSLSKKYKNLFKTSLISLSLKRNISQIIYPIRVCIAIGTMQLLFIHNKDSQKILVCISLNTVFTSGIIEAILIAGMVIFSIRIMGINIIYKPTILVL